jgi:hypothetical protein
MSHRIGCLSLVVLLCGGIFAWMVLAPPLTAQDPPVNPEPEVEVPATTPAPDTAPAEKSSAKAIPAPPAQRAEGIFDFHEGNKIEQNIQKALVDPQGVNIEFIDTPLKDAMEFIADAQNITILIDEQALTEEGVAIDEPLNRTLSGVKLESALKIILEPLGLTHIIEDEVLKITTEIHAKERRLTRVYHTGYLKQIGVEPEALGKTILAVVEPEEWRGDSPQSPVATTSEKQAVVVRDPEGRIRVGTPALMRTMQVGGSASEATPDPARNSLEVLGDMLVVSAPKATHDKIRGLLIQLDRRWELEHGKK